VVSELQKVLGQMIRRIRGLEVLRMKQKIRRM
jgi:hypothetical protein